MTELEVMGKKAREASRRLAKAGTNEKNAGLRAAADSLRKNAPQILEANQIDLENARANNMKPALIDRLLLDEARIESIAQGMEAVADLDDPIGQIEHMSRRPNGLLIGRMRVPLGVVGVIYEARPNVTADVFALTYKSGNAVILKGGKEAANSNKAITEAIRSALDDPDAVQLIEDNSRENTAKFMRLREYVDVLIPRGGKGLIQAAVTQATIPVIETGTGNCHAYIDESADDGMAVSIINNGKTQRIGVCNALESIVVNSKKLGMLKKLEEKLDEHHVQIRADERSLPYFDHAVPADEADYSTEYLDYIISVKTVDSLDEAIEHINRCSTGHSETIITNDYGNAARFLNEVDSAAVYVNASTRFTDGNEFGFGAEIGISTQKLHARGPMGLDALTTTKFIVQGTGQIR